MLTITKDNQSLVAYSNQRLCGYDYAGILIGFLSPNPHGKGWTVTLSSSALLLGKLSGKLPEKVLCRDRKNALKYLVRAEQKMFKV